MIVFILDLDGTLMPSHELDNECYWRAVDAVYGPGVGTQGVGHFEHVTDAGILGQWVEERTGCRPTDSDTAQVKNGFLDLLRHEAKIRPSAFKATPGVEAWLEAINANPDVTAGIATGGWAHTARFKLEISSLCRFELPLASCDDAVSRTAIMRQAQTMICSKDARGADRITYVGDSPWDAICAARLGWEFIGIATGKRAELLFEAGAVTVHQDFIFGERT